MADEDLGMTIIERYNHLDGSDQSTVGLVEHSADLEADWERVFVKPKYLAEFAQKAQDMGMEYLAMYVRDGYPVFAHEYDDDFGYHLCLAPAIPEEDDDVGE